MKNKVIYTSAALLLLTVGFTSCEKKSKDLTSVTYYAQLELAGPDIFGVDYNSTFVDPGYTAVMNGKDVSDQVKVTSNVDPTKKGVYSVTYRIVNADGFSSGATRTVVVYDFSDPYEGVYLVDPTSYRIYEGGDPVLYGGAYYTLAWNAGSGVYQIDDLIAGWYDQRAGYGPECAMQAEVSFASDGTMTLIDSYIPYWEDGADELTDAKFDETTGILTYHVKYGGQSDPPVAIDFYVTLLKADF